MPGRRMFLSLVAFVLLGGIGAAAYLLITPNNTPANAATVRDHPFRPHSYPVEGQSTQNPATVHAIEHSYQTFFAQGTSLNKRVAVLQNGRAFRKAVAGLFASDEGHNTVVAVDRVNVTGSRATVKYWVYVHQVLEIKPTGAAVKHNGSWLVSDSTFCRVLNYEGMHAAACPPGS